MVLFYVINLLLLLAAAKFSKHPPGLPTMMYLKLGSTAIMLLHTEETILLKCTSSNVALGDDAWKLLILV